MKIRGLWKEGYVLDYHTKSSDFVGHDAYGHRRFDTVRTEVGDLLYRLKYRGRKEAVNELISVAATFIRNWNPPVDAIVPVPPTGIRKAQPVLWLAKGLAKRLELPLRDVVRRQESLRQLKNVFDYHERTKLLENAYHVTSTAVSSKPVLLVDDLYRSGATLNAVAGILRTGAKVSAVYAFALTRTRRAS